MSRRVCSEGKNDHPLCQNISEGNWLLLYLIDRIDNKRLGSILTQLVQPVLDLPTHFRARYHLHVIRKLSDVFFSAVLERLPSWMAKSRFIRRAAVATVAVFGKVKGAYWPIDDAENTGSLSAGLPHFAGGWAELTF